MAKALVEMFFGSLGIVVLFGYAWMIAMGVFVPIWMMLLLRRLTRIARALEEPPADRSALAERMMARTAEYGKDIPMATPGHQLLR